MRESRNICKYNRLREIKPTAQLIKGQIIKQIIRTPITTTFSTFREEMNKEIFITIAIF